MPNYVTNIIKLSGEKDDIKKLIDSITVIKDDKQYVDFNKIIPMPESLNVESGSSSDSLISLYYYYENGDLSHISKWKPKDISIDEYIKKRHEICGYTKEKALVYINNIKNYGAPTWYEWCVMNWGTKWNAIDSEIGKDQIKFETAWSGVPNLLYIVSKNNPNVTIEYTFADEDWGANVGYFRFKNGESIHEEIPENFSKRAIAIATEVLGSDPWFENNSEEDDE